MKTLFYIVLSICSLNALAAAPTISTGPEVKNYYRSYGPNLAKAMSASKHFKGENMPKVVASQGSLDNLAAVGAHSADLGLTQPDAYSYWRKQDPNLANHVAILGQLPVHECVFVVVKDDGKISSLESLKDSSTAKINIGPDGAGSQASWAYISKKLGLTKVATESQPDILALGAVQTGGIDAMIFVSAKDVVNEAMEIVNADDSGLKFLPIDDDSLSEKLPNGKQVYAIESAKVRDSVFGSKVKVPCQDLLVIGNTENAPQVNEEAARAILRNGASIAQINE